jgi:hypothetical protein
MKEQLTVMLADEVIKRILVEHKDFLDKFGFREDGHYKLSITFKVTRDDKIAIQESGLSWESSDSSGDSSCD